MSNEMSEPANTQVGVIGAGNIGRAFALVFADAGFTVCLCEQDAETARSAIESIASSLDDLRSYGLCQSETDAVLSRISIGSSLDHIPCSAEMILECIPEDLQLKRELFAQLEHRAAADTVLASASSALPMSQIAAGLDTPERCIVAHPGNPPFLVRVVELVPAPFTNETTVSKTRGLLASAGLQPVVLRKEVRGFVFNRLQGALLREAYCLVRDGVADVDDIDAIVRDGLGLRWAVVGPFETADLNWRGGIEAHARIMGDAYAAMGAERSPDDVWADDLVTKVAAQRRQRLPLDEWDARVRWRDQQLMQLLRARTT